MLPTKDLDENELSVSTCLGNVKRIFDPAQVPREPKFKRD